MAQHSYRSPRKGYIAALAATVAWSSSGIFVAYLTGRFRMPPLALAFWRNLIITVALLGGLSLLGTRLLRLEYRHIRLLGLYGLVLAALNGLFPVSVVLNGAAVATLLIYSAPVFSALASRVFLGEKLGSLKIAAVAVGLAGCVLVSEAYDPALWQVNVTGIAVGLGTGLSFAVYGLVGRILARRGVHAWTAMAHGFSVSTLLLLVLLRGAAVDWLPSSPLGGHDGGAEAALGWGVLALLALGPTLAGHGLYTASLAHLPASTATLIVTLEPLLTAALAYLLLRERMGAYQLLGGCLVLASVVAVTIGDSRGRKRAAQDPLASREMA